MVFVCTEGAAHRRDGTDWVYAELDYWLRAKAIGPIIVDATGEGGRYLPRVISKRWPAAQRRAVTVIRGADVPDGFPGVARARSAESTLVGRCGTCAPDAPRRSAVPDMIHAPAEGRTVRAVGGVNSASTFTLVPAWTVENAAAP